METIHRRAVFVPTRNARLIHRWFRLAADAGDMKAQFCVGTAYHSASGVPRDEEQAACWYEKAAQQGHAKAQFNLALCYKHGHGVEKDMQQALAWFKKASDAGIVAELSSSTLPAALREKCSETRMQQAMQYLYRAAEQKNVRRLQLLHCACLAATHPKSKP